MKFSLPANAKDAGPHKYHPVMPPNTAKNKTASQGSNGNNDATATANKPKTKELVSGFHGSPTGYTAPTLQKPLYEKPKAR